jgi:hypothetical protein
MTQEQRENNLKWIAALRSGRFTQGKDQLKCIGGITVQHCCLGVACEVMEIPSEGDVYRFPDMTMNKTPPSGWFQEKFGLDYGVIQTLYTKNDDYGQSFNQIADYIETTYLKDHDSSPIPTSND